jgi:hypothetical protein
VSRPADVGREDGILFRPVHRIAPVRVTATHGDEQSSGTGSLTLIAEGHLPEYGLSL